MFGKREKCRNNAREYVASIAVAYKHTDKKIEIIPKIYKYQSFKSIKLDFLLWSFRSFRWTAIIYYADSRKVF